MESCPICNEGTMQPAERTLRAEVNGHVFIATVMGRRCDACNEGVIDGRDLEQFELAVASALADAGDASGEAFRYARKTLGLTAAELAAVLGVTPESISRWENAKHPIDPMALTIVALLVRDAAAGSTALLDALRARTVAKPLAKRVTLKLAS
jgi:putative zinc finger/helix-turn-helix YgiT family protein